MPKNPIPTLRAIGYLEGISFLLLLGVAMPLKYIYGMPKAVSIVGMAHGVLFVLLLGWLLYTKTVALWPLGRSATVFVASLLPFGPWFIDRKLKRWTAEYEAERAKAGSGTVG